MNTLTQLYSKRSFGTSVYLWRSLPRLGPKATEIKQQFSISRGVPGKIERFDSLNIKKLFVGLRHSAAISENGELFTFGSGNWGALGHGGEADVSVNEPKRVETFVSKGKKVKDVALGEYHTLVLSEEGDVYTFGYGGKSGYFNWMYS